MADELYKETLDAAKVEMDELLKEEGQMVARLAEVHSRIDVLRKTIISIGDLLGEDREPATVGITDAIRAVLKAKDDSFLSPAAVRAQLKQSAFPLDTYKNVMPVIH